MRPRDLKLCAAILLLISFLACIPAGRAIADVETRISWVISWMRDQLVSDSHIEGFAHGSVAPDNRRVFVEDHALIALALSDYRSTHNDPTYDGLVKMAVNFVMAGRTLSGDFYEYYDLDTRQWLHAGDIYSWNAYAIACLAAAAYKITSKSPQEKPFWSSIVTRLKQSVNGFLPNHRSDGAWVFRDYGTGLREALIRENAMLLAGLQYLALFEHEWGSNQSAQFYAQLSEQTARWLFSMQVTDPLLSTIGGFPHSDRNSTQISEENGAVLFGVDTYYSIIGVLVSAPSPTIWDARRVMADWVSGFARRMRDEHGGPFNSRDSLSVMEYPKFTRAAAWMLQALVDIWINLGGSPYYDDSQRSYDWIVGDNELGADMQSAFDISGSSRGFYNSIAVGSVDRKTTTDVSASALYGFVRAGFILVPEFPTGAGEVLLFLALVVALLVCYRSRKRLIERD